MGCIFAVALGAAEAARATEVGVSRFSAELFTPSRLDLAKLIVGPVTRYKDPWAKTALRDLNADEFAAEIADCSVIYFSTFAPGGLPEFHMQCPKDRVRFSLKEEMGSVSVSGFARFVPSPAPEAMSKQ